MLRNLPSPILVAAVTAALALIWLIADVELTDAGNLSGLFYVGAKSVLPDDLAARPYRVRDERGYDGQFYYLIAHDPLNQHGFLSFVDTPRYRWRRIALPGLAHLLAFGSEAWVDRIFVALQLVFVYFGSYWLAAYAMRNGRAAIWGVAFLIIPAVAVSLDRMTVDLPLAAFCIALLYDASLYQASLYQASLYQASSSRPRLLSYVALAAAPLVRETGILLIVAWCAFWAIKRRPREVFLGVGCAIPTAGWWLYVASHTNPDVASVFASIPFSGLITWTVHALEAPTAVYGPRANAVLELVALAGIWLAFGLTAYVVAQRRLDRNSWNLPELIALVFSGFASLIGYQDIWATDYGMGRTLSPLLIALAAVALRDRRPIFSLPLLLAAPRIALQFAAELKVALLLRPTN